LVNLDEDLIEVYSNPSGKGYVESRNAQRGGSLQLPSGLHGEVNVDDVLGKI
jgi:hypothetical protein